jgi:hypothetical protein
MDFRFFLYDISRIGYKSHGTDIHVWDKDNMELQEAC